MRFALAATLLFASSVGIAADTGLYLGAAVTQARFEEDNLDLDALGTQVTDLDDEDTSWKAIAGFRLHDNFSVEANYIDFGEAQTGALPLIGRAFAEAKGFSAYAIGLMPVGPADLYAKAGAVHTEVEAGAGNFSIDEHSTEFAYRAGV